MCARKARKRQQAVLTQKAKHTSVNTPPNCQKTKTSPGPDTQKAAADPRPQPPKTYAIRNVNLMRVAIVESRRGVGLALVLGICDNVVVILFASLHGLAGHLLDGAAGLGGGGHLLVALVGLGRGIDSVAFDSLDLVPGLYGSSAYLHQGRRGQEDQEVFRVV